MTTIDITNYTDNAVDVILASRTGEDVDCDHLTAKERYQVAEALGWDLKAGYVRAWIADVGDHTPRAAVADDRLDYEGMILDDQEDFAA